MLYIVKQYKKLFSYLLCSKFSETPWFTEAQVRGIDGKGGHENDSTANGRISKLEANALLNNSKLVNELISDGDIEISGFLKKLKEKNLLIESIKAGTSSALNETPVGILEIALADIIKYLEIYNKIYGGVGKLISSHNGILGVLMHLQKSDLDRFYEELKANGFKDIKKKEEFAQELGLSRNSKDYEAGVKRMIVITAIGTLLSGGANIPVELLGINIPFSDLDKGPGMSAILKAVRGGQKEGKKNDSEVKTAEGMVKDVQVDENTTVEGLQRLIKLFNNEQIHQKNLKRAMREIYNTNFISRFFGSGSRKAESLIERLEGSSDIEMSRQISEDLIKMALREIELKYMNKYGIKNFTEANINDKFKKLMNQEKRSIFVDEVDYTKSSVKEELEDALEDLKAYQTLGKIVSLFTQFDKKADSKDTSRERMTGAKRLNMELEIDKEAKTVVDKLQKVGITGNKYTDKAINFDKGSREGDIVYMQTHTGNKETSILAGIMRGIKEYYGIPFSVEAFKDAYIKGERVEAATVKEIISNTQYRGDSKFQGKAEGPFLKMDINGKIVYLKGDCANPLIFVDDIETTVESRYSVPAVASISTGGNNPPYFRRRGPGSRPGNGGGSGVQQATQANPALGDL